MEKEHIMIPAQNSEYVCVCLQQPTSGLCFSVIFRSVTRQAGVITLSIPVQVRLWVEQIRNVEKRQNNNFFLIYN